MDYISIFKEFSTQLKTVIENQISQANVDRTFKAVIIKKISDGKYQVQYQRKKYTVSANKSYSVGDVVRVCAPCNDWSDLFVVW